MMKRLKQWIVDYYKKRSVWSLVSDIVFFVLVILLLIPATRREIMSRVIRLTMRQPAERAFDTRESVKVSDYYWPLQELDGQGINFKDLEGQVIFLNFWATWCPPCIAEMPSVQKLYDRYGDRVTFLLVTHEDPARVRAFLEKHGYDLPVYIQEYQEPEVFRSPTIPTTFILSGDGRLVLEKKGATKWDSRNIRELLDGLLRGS